MSVIAPAPASSPDAAAATVALSPGLRASGRRALFWVIAAIGLLMVAVVVSLIRGTGGVGGERFGADNPGPIGSQALVEVLRDHGVEVEVAPSLDAALASADADSTLFVADTGGLLGAEQLRRLRDATSDLVVAEPGFELLRTIAPDVALGGAPTTDTAKAGCAVPAAERAGTITTGERSLSTDSPDWAVCFPTGEAGASAGMLQRTTSGSTVTLVADGGVLLNDSIADEGNAALAIGLLGAHERLVWYLPSLADLAGTAAPTLAELTPSWVTPVLMLGILVVIDAAIWQGRRFGPLVVEDLPVTVRASETMEGRARLYARTRARLRAADALRIGTLDRLTGRLGLPRSATLPDVVSGVAAATSTPASAVSDVLVDRVPNTDRELVALSDDLEKLESALRRATEIATAPPGRMDT